MFIQVGAGAEGSRAVGTWVRLLATVGAGVLSEPGSHAEALATDPTAERPQATVDAFVVLQVGQLAEAFATCGTLVDKILKQGKRMERKYSSQQSQCTKLNCN